MKGVYDDFLVQQEFSRSKRKEFKTALKAAKAVEKKKIDMLICDLPVVWWLAGMNEIVGLVAVPVLRSEEQLLSPDSPKDAIPKLGIDIRTVVARDEVR